MKGWRRSGEAAKRRSGEAAKRRSGEAMMLEYSDIAHAAPQERPAKNRGRPRVRAPPAAASHPAPTRRSGLRDDDRNPA
ncbi:putative Atu [Burkholderia pseudomallei 1106b]|nr:putative Atu [Burkholderia pseudomallei 1106b]